MRRIALGALIIVLAVSVQLSVASSAKERATPSPSPSSSASTGTESGGAIRLGKAHPASYGPVLDSKKPIFILVLGSDTRSKQDSAVQHSKCDSIHIIGINPAKDQASILGFPRDSWIKLPGGGSGKINEMCYGGPAGAVSTMEALTGIRLDYYAVAGFYDFRDVVAGVGTVTVDLPYAIKDSHSKANFDKGKTDMSGKEALRYVRSRYDVPGGDFGRSANQGYFLMQMLKQFEKQSKKDPSVLLRYLGVVMAQIKTDISYDELLELAFTIREIDPDKIPNKVTPGSIGHEGAESVVHLTSGANAMYRDMAGDGLLKG